MGGNVTAINKKTGEETPAVKIPLKEIGIKYFRETFVDLFKYINKKFKQKYKEPLWVDETKLANGFMFNGSTSYIMNPDYSDEEIIKYKPSAGDLDIIIPDDKLKDLWYILDAMEGERYRDLTYMGCNKLNPDAIGNQINCVFILHYKDFRIPCQIDFEALPFENSSPTAWAKFSHSSSFEDAKVNIKAAHHKLLLRSLVGALSQRDDIVIATPKSTPDNIKFKKLSDNPRMRQFAVDRGLGTAYKPMLDNNGKPIFHNNKQVYIEMPTSERDYITDIESIFKMVFKTNDTSMINQIESFIGVVRLLKKYATKEDLILTRDRYFDTLWGARFQGQVIESRSKELDYQVKITGFNHFLKELKLPKVPNQDKIIEDYYINKFKD